MKKEIKDIDKEKGIIRITTTDERFYSKPSKSVKTGLPEYKFVPSVTWVCSFYPKGIAFYRWLADKGWDESIALRDAAGARGSKVHSAVELLVRGESITIDSVFLNTMTGEFEELGPDEYEAVVAFSNWFESVKPTVVGSDFTVWSDVHNYAGTVDLLLKIKDKKTGKLETWIVDIKTGQHVWKEQELQVSAYKYATVDAVDAKLAILQVGYRRNKNKYKFTEIEDCFDLFLVAKQLWAVDNEGVNPTQKDFPIEIKLSKVAVKEEVKPQPKKKVKAK